METFWYWLTQIYLLKWLMRKLIAEFHCCRRPVKCLAAGRVSQMQVLSELTLTMVFVAAINLTVVEL